MDGGDFEEPLMMIFGVEDLDGWVAVVSGSVATARTLFERVLRTLILVVLFEGK